MPGTEREDDSVISVVRIKSEVPQKRRKPKKIKIPRREPSIVVPEREIIFITPDKTCCKICSCYPKEDPYSKNKKLKSCQISPLSLYEIAGAMVDKFPWCPEQFSWTVEDVAYWMAHVVGLPQYKSCIRDNYINGRRLVLLEDPSVLPQINIHDFEHIKMITAEVRKTFSMEMIRYTRSINLLLRKPNTYLTYFKSRTGPTWGIRHNWTCIDVLRSAQILMAKPAQLNHWDLVWHEEPEFPKVILARRPRTPKDDIPRYKAVKEICNEYLAPRRFRLQNNIPEEAQLIWMEHRIGSPTRKMPTPDKRPSVVPMKKVYVEKESRLIPKDVNLAGLKGKDLILARRRANKPKFLKSPTSQPGRFGK